MPTTYIIRNFQPLMALNKKRDLYINNSHIEDGDYLEFLAKFSKEK